MKALLALVDPVERERAASLLEEENCTATTVKSPSALRQGLADPLAVLLVAQDGIADLDAFRCCRLAKDTAPNRVTAMLIAADGENSLWERFEASGADDLLLQPVPTPLLRSRLRAALRLAKQGRLLEELQQRTTHELRLAKQMFERILKRRPALPAHVRHWTWPAGHFSGDTLLYGTDPEDGSLNIFLGDFTGHGLAAAVGTLPTADIFHAMTAKSFSIADIAKEINRKLHAALPTGHFCAAALLRLDATTKAITICNAGMPPVLALDECFRPLRRFSASHTPLGILPPGVFDVACETLDCDSTVALVAYSDGLVECQNVDGEMFGEERLADALATTLAHPPMIDAVKRGLLSFIDGLEPADDVTIVGVSVL